MKRYLLLLLAAASLLFCGYVYPDNAPYIVIQEGTTDYYIYLSSSNVDSIAIDGNKVINISASTVYGYSTINGTEYRITFPVYDYPYYTYRSGTQNVTHTFSNPVAVTVHNFDPSAAQVRFEYLYLALLGGILFVCLVKSRR